MGTSRPVVRAAVAVGLPVATAAALVPLRREFDNASIALALALAVGAVATLGQRWPTAVAAVAAALSFDLLHTEPFGSLTISGGDDTLKTILLLLVGLGAASLVSRRAEAEAGLEERRFDLRRVREVTRASERSPEAVVERLELELTQLLELESATYRAGEDGDGSDPMPRITSQGIVIPPGTPPLDPERPGTWVLELPVCTVGGQVGRFVLHPTRPTSGVDLPPGRRDLALTWADQLALRSTDRPGTGAPVADVVLLGLAVAFFALAGLYVTACDRLVGRERLGSTAIETSDEAGPIAR